MTTAQLKVASSVPSEEPAVLVAPPEPGAAVAADVVAAAAVVEALAWAVFSETFSMPPVAPQEYQSTA